MFMAATMNVTTFIEKNFSTVQNFIMNFEDLTLKQVFDVTGKSMGWIKFIGERIHGDNCH